MMLRVPISSTDHYLGPLSAPAHLVEYGDFGYPECARVVTEIDPLLDEFNRDLCFVFRHFPVKERHPYAEMAALAAEAAALQGQFWPMHHELFANQDSLSETTILALAEFLALDIPSFERDLSRRDLRQRVRRQYEGGMASGVREPPAFFLNGKRFEGPATCESFRRSILTLLATQKLA